MSAVLEAAVDRFIADVGQDVTAIAAAEGAETARIRADVDHEAAELVTAFIDADTQHGDVAL